MILWRISRHRDLSGEGGLRAAGRWHEAGRPVVYLAESPAAAMRLFRVSATFFSKPE